MRTFVIFAVAFAVMAIPPALPAEEGNDCQVSLELLGKKIWDIKVGPKKITGDSNTLTREGNVIYGFAAGKAVRFRVVKDRMAGSYAGAEASLKVEGEKDRVKIRGFFGHTRFIVKTEGDQLELTDQAITLRLKRKAVPGEPPGVSLTDESGKVRVLFQGCDVNLMQSRPELALVLHRMILPRVADLEDVGHRLPASSAGTSGAQQRSSSGSSGRTPPSK